MTVFNLIDDGFELWGNRAQTAFNLATTFIGDLRNFDVSPINFDSTFTVPNNLLAGFQHPDRPDAPNVEFQVDVPEPLEIQLPDIPDFGQPPENTTEKPTLNFENRPGPINVPAPDDPPDLEAVLIPDKPEFSFPEVPDLEELNIPDAPTIVEHEFEGERPVFDVEAPEPGLNFVEEEYSSDLLDQTTAKIKSIIENGEGLPAFVEQQIFDRAREREDVNANRAIQEATEEFAARGFTLPSGELARRIKEARQNNQDKQSELNREITVQIHNVEIENMRFAIAQGIALEGQLLQAHLNVMERSFRFAQATVETAISIFNARVQAYNTELQAYRVDAEVYRALINAELAKLENFRTQLEAERVRSEINQQRIDVYRTRIQAIQQIIDTYRAEIEASNAVARTNESKIRAYAARIEAYKSQVEAKTEEYRAWAEGIRGELGKVQAYEAETRAYLADVQAFQVATDAKAIKPRLELSVQESRVQQASSQLDTTRAMIAAEGERVRGKASIFSSQAQIYGADGSIAANHASANTRQFQAALEKSRLVSEQAIKTADLNINQLVALNQQRLDAIRGGADVGSNLAASALSAINMGARVSASESTNFNYSF